VREVIEALLPSRARIAFLIAAEPVGADLGGHEVWALPSDSPSPDRLIDSIKALEESGIEFVVIPESSFDWLAEHAEVGDRLRKRHRFVTRQEHLCEIYELQGRAPHGEEAADETAEQEPTEGAQGGKPHEESNAGGRSFGEKLRGVLFPSRRNGPRP
jgi:hypothetical protein